MTVSSSTTRTTPAVGNDANTSFPFTFKVFAEADIDVVYTDADGVETTLVLDSTYSVALNADQEANPGGTVTYPLSGSPLTTTDYITIVRAVDYTQTLDLTLGGSFNPTNIENALDRMCMLSQQNAEVDVRTMRLPVSDVSGADTTLPAPVADELIGWNSAGDALEGKALSSLSVVDESTLLRVNTPQTTYVGSLTITFTEAEVAELDLGTVVAGDLFAIQAHIIGTKGGTAGDLKARVDKKSGTATFSSIFTGGPHEIFAKYCAASVAAVASGMLIYRVLTAGTLVINLSATSVSSDVTSAGASFAAVKLT